MTGSLCEPVMAAYIHVPFCVRKCAYCDFASYAGCLDRLPAYVDALLREIRIAGRSASHPNGTPEGRESVHKPLTSVFFGGGTPSLLSPSHMDRLLSGLSDAFGLASGCEISLEANPGTVALPQLQAYRQSGCNRISIGIQSMQPSILRLLGRIHQPDEGLTAIRLAAAAGFDRISADLMFGLPQQTVSDVETSVQTILELPVTHLSFYSLSIEPGTVFFERYDRHPEELPDDEMERAQYEAVREMIAKAGMVHYEISNAAVPGEECRHNLVYWQARPYHGFGAGAHSYTDGIRRGNTADIDTYVERILKNDQPFAAADSAVTLTRSQQEQEFMLLGLRLLEGVDADVYHSRFGGDLFTRFSAELDTLSASGLLERDGRRIRLTRKGLDLANQVFIEFV